MAANDSQILIDYVIKHTKLSQADLARELKVSRAQITKWKSGEYLPSERASELLKLAGLFDTLNIEWAIFAKTTENAEAWYSYVYEIFDSLESESPLKDLFYDMPDIQVGHLIIDLCNLGAQIEATAPKVSDDDEELDSTPLSSALHSILQAWGDLKHWIDITLDFDDLTDDAESDLMDVVGNLECLVFELALENVEKELLTDIGIKEELLSAAIRKSRKEIKSSLRTVCNIRTKHGLPITEDYFELLYLSSEDLEERDMFRPGAFGNDEDAIKAYLPYGERMILSHLECSAKALTVLNEKLDLIIKKIGTGQ